jgi:cell wall-associated NlpC family hydrolase
VKPATVSSPAQKAAAVAIQQVGVRYQYGGASPGGFDCSGLVHYAYSKAGKRIPRTTAAQWNNLRPVANHDLRVGDILFFRIAGKMSHVGMYLGGGDFVHAPSTGGAVSVASLRSEFYQAAYIRAGRPD